MRLLESKGDIMKFILKYLLVILLLPTISAAQQSAYISRIDSIKNVVVHLYNSDQADSIYLLSDESYHQFITKDHFIQWLQSSRQETGKILSTKKMSQENEGAVYLTNFQNGQLNLLLAIDQSGKIQGFGFRVPEKNYPAKSNNPLKNHIDSVVEEAIRPYIQQKNTVGASIGIIENGQFYKYDYGEIAKGNSHLPEGNTIYEIGSITKTFTATLLAEMVLEGKCKFSDPVNKYLPDNVKELKKDGVLVTLEMLANHTSGLPHIPSDLFSVSRFSMNDPYKNYDTTDLFNYLDTVRLRSVPGKYFRYSNLGFGLLGVILERMTGISYQNLLEEYICDPLQLPDTRTELKDKQQKHFAPGYDEKGNAVGHWHFASLAGCGVIRSSVNDLLKYLNAHLTEDTSTNLLKAFRLCERPSFAVAGGHIGLAWMIPNRSPGWFWHNGGTGGFRSYCAFNPNKKIAFVILSNSALGVDDAGISLIKALSP